MTKTSKYWDKRALERLNNAEKQSEEYINRVKAIYNQAYKNIDSEIARIYKNYAKDTGLDVQKLKELLTKSKTKKFWEEMKRQGLDKYVKDNYKSRISRLEQLQAQIYAKAKLIYPKEELENTMCYKGVINDSYYKAIYDTQIGTGYDFSFNMLDNNLLNSVLNENWSGKHYSKRIWGNTDILANSLSELLGGALLSGQSIEKTSKQIRDRFDVSKYYAERLIRTETNHFNNEADAMAYEEMGIDKYVFVATLDNRTSPMCQDMDGQIFNYKDRETGVNYPPLHPNCRSKTRGYLGEEAEKNLQRRARNPITGKTELVDNISYKEWIKENTVNKLTSDEKYAITEYISPTAYTLNDSLRNDIPLNATQEKIVKDLDRALDKMDNYVGDVTRSVWIESEDIEYFLRDYQVGNIITNKSYISSTIGDTYNPEAKVQMFINSKTGKNITKYNKAEKEILFKRGSKFKVLDIDRTDDYFVKIFLNEV